MFCNETKGCDIRRAYMLWLWMDTLYSHTFQRVQDGGNLELGVMPSLGSLAFEQSIDTMHLEFPLILYAHLLQNHTSEASSTCASFYESFKLTQNQTSHLCNKTLNSFNNGYLNNGTSIALDSAVNFLNIYFYGSKFNNTLYTEFLNLTKMTP